MKGARSEGAAETPWKREQIKQEQGRHRQAGSVGTATRQTSPGAVLRKRPSDRYPSATAMEAELLAPRVAGLIPRWRWRPNQAGRAMI